MALDVVAVLDAADVATAAVFGASMGGLVAQHVVVDHPARVADLILAATSPGGDAGVDPRPEDQAALMGKGARTPEDAYRIACTVLYSPQFQRAHPEFIEAQIRERALIPCARASSLRSTGRCGSRTARSRALRQSRYRRSSCTALMTS